MKTLVVISVISVLLLLYVNIRVTHEIEQSVGTTRKERVQSYIALWLIPFLGVLLVSKKVLPRLHAQSEGTGILSGVDSSDAGSAGSAGGDCG